MNSLTSEIEQLESLVAELKQYCFFYHNYSNMLELMNSVLSTFTQRPITVTQVNTYLRSIIERQRQIEWAKYRHEPFQPLTSLEEEIVRESEWLGKVELIENHMTPDEFELLQDKRVRAYRISLHTIVSDLIDDARDYLTQCRRVIRLIRSSQQRFKERYYAPSGRYVQRGKERFYSY